MTTLRFTPPSSGQLANSGRIDLASNWSPAQAPAPGDTAIITSGTLYIREETLSGIGLFAFTTSIYTGTGPELQLRNVTLAANSTLVVEGDLFVGTGVGLSQKFENDGRIELSNFANFGGADGYSFVNKGTLILNSASIAGSTAVENDGVIRLANVPYPGFDTNITGTGSILVAPGSNFLISLFSSTQTVVLTGGTAAHSTLSLGNMAAPIAGFVAGDTLASSSFYGDATKVSYANTGANRGTLTVGGGSNTVSVNIVGTYAATDFVATVSPRHVLSITTTRADGSIDATSPIYRFFDTVDGTHFSTGSAAERDTIVNTRPDLAFEGVTLNAADPNGAAAAAIFRFFDTVHGTHFYTADPAERDAVRASRPDLTFEGTAFSEHLSAQPGDTPVFRFFDTRLGTHFYTASASEAATTMQSRPDLTSEGIAFYAPS